MHLTAQKKIQQEERKNEEMGRYIVGIVLGFYAFRAGVCI
jgi:hypothetical protein